MLNLDVLRDHTLGLRCLAVNLWPNLFWYLLQFYVVYRNGVKGVWASTRGMRSTVMWMLMGRRGVMQKFSFRVDVTCGWPLSVARSTSHLWFNWNWSSLAECVTITEIDAKACSTFWQNRLGFLWKIANKWSMETLRFLLMTLIF